MEEDHMKVLLIVPLLMVGCASTNYETYIKAQRDMAEEYSKAEVARVKAIADIAKKSKDSASQVAAVMSLAMINTNHSNYAIAPPQNEALQWASVLVPGLTNVAAGYFGYSLGKATSDNAREVSISTNNAFANMGGSIERIGLGVTTMNPSVNTTNTYTLSGTGVLGSGSYIGPVTTNRNCNNTITGTTTPSGLASC